MSLIARPINYLDRTANKVVGGSILFGDGRPIRAKYIDTTFLNISAFRPISQLNFEFRLEATFSNGTKRVLWRATLDSTGCSVPKKIFVLADSDHLYCTYVELVASTPVGSIEYLSNTNPDSKYRPTELVYSTLEVSVATPNYYFIFWDLVSASKIIVSEFQKTVLHVSKTLVKCSYNDIYPTPGSYAADFPTTPFYIPDNLVEITNSVQHSLTGDVSWSISSFVASNVSVKGLEAEAFSIYRVGEQTSNQMRMRLHVLSNIYYNGPLYITAANSNGILSHTEIHLQLASIPRFVGCNVAHLLLSPSYSFNVGTVVSEGSGYLKWNVVSSLSHLSYNSMLSITSDGVATIKNNFICDDVSVYASNINNVSYVSSTQSMRIVSAPIIKTPQTLITTIIHDSNLTYTKLHQTSLTTGPLTWYKTFDSATVHNIQNNEFSIAPTTGVVTISSNTYIEGYVNFFASNALGHAVSRKVYTHVAPQPYFTSPESFNVSVSDDNFTYQYDVIFHYVAPIQWSISPSTTQVQINKTTGLLTLTHDNYLINEPFVITATNAVGNTFSRQIRMTSANNPIVIANTSIQYPGSNIFSMENDDVLVELKQKALLTGEITWGIKPQPNVPGVSDLSIVSQTNSNAYLKIMQNHPVDSYVTVYASNILQGYSQTSFYLQVSQIPIIRAPTNQSSNVPVSYTYTYPMRVTTSDTHIKWYLLDSPSWISINELSGVISVAPNTLTNANIVIGASNAYGGSAVPKELTIDVYPIPEFTAPTVLYGTISGSVFTYTFSKDSSDIINWTVTDSANQSVTNLVINDGVLTYASNVPSFDKNIIVTAYNTNNYPTSKEVHTSLLAQPLVKGRDTVLNVLCNMKQGDAQYTYKMELDNSDVFQLLHANVTWSIQGSQLPGMTIDSSTGLITFVNNTSYSGYNIPVRASTGAQFGGYSEAYLNISVHNEPVISPDVSTSITCNLNNGEIFSYLLPQTAIGTGALQWSITPNIQGLSISNNGILTLGANYSVDSSITVTTTNAAFGSSEISLSLKVGRTPILRAPPSIFGSVLDTQNFTYPFNQVARGTGPLHASIISPGTPPIADDILMFSDDAILKVASNNFISTTGVTVGLSNDTGGLCNVTFDLRVLHRPTFSLQQSLSSTQQRDSAYTYQVTNTMTEANHGPISWFVGSSNSAQGYLSSLPSIQTISGLSISSSGLITCEQNRYINCNIIVFASNQAHDIYAASTALVVVTETLLTKPNNITHNYIIYANIDYTTLPVQYNSTVGTGPLTWSITDDTNKVVPYLTISPSGVVHYGSSSPAPVPALNSNVTVRASNILNVASSTQFKMVITKSPSLLLSVPDTVVGSMYDQRDFTYQLTNFDSSFQAGLFWYFTYNPDNTNLSINSSTGVLTFAHENRIACNVTVSASNANNIFDSKTFFLDVAQSPSIIVPQHQYLSNTFLVDDSSPYSYSFQMGSNYSSNITGDLTWQVGTGVNLETVDGFRIDANNGRITYTSESRTYVNKEIVVLANNNNGGSNQVQFNVVLANQPYIIPPLPELLSILGPSSETYTLQYVSASNVENEPILWTYSPLIDGLSISDTGLLTLSPQSNLNCNITVTATNVLGSSDSNISYIGIRAVPNIVAPDDNLLNCSVPFDSNYTVTVKNMQTRAQPLSWSLEGIYPGVTINNTTGMLTVASPNSLTTNVTVTATNTIQSTVYTDRVIFTPNIVRDPIINIPPPDTFIAENLANSFKYTFTQCNLIRNYTGKITWSVHPQSNSSYLSIDRQTGELTYDIATSNSINTLVTVSSKNVYNVENSVTFPMKITGDPVLGTDSTRLEVYENNIKFMISYSNGKYFDELKINNSNLERLAITNSNVYNDSNLVPDTWYKYILTPRNVFGSNGTPYNVEVTTLPSAMSNFAINDVTNTSLKLSWQNTIYSNLSLKQVDDSLQTSNIYTIMNDTSCNYSLTGLNPNRQYTFTMTPFNSVNVAGVFSNLSVLTQSDFGNIKPNINITYSNVVATFYPSSNNYNFINISWSNITLGTPPSSDRLNYSRDVYTYDFALQENTNYVINLSSLNNNNVIGETSNYNIVTKSAFQSELTLIQQSEYEYDLIWGPGTYTYSKVQITKTKVESGNYVKNDYVVGNLTGIGLYNINLNKDYYKYVFTVTAYNSEDVAGEQRSIEHYLV